GGKAAARRRKPSEHAVEVRTARGGTAFHDDEPVRREHERRHLAPELLRRATRAASWPKRTSCASARVRGEKPCVPTCSDSSRFVFPAPLGPVTSTRPGSSSKSSFAYER